MKKNNFIRVAAFITAFTFISAQSAYGPSVYALQKMDDEQLADVEAAAVNIDLNLTVRAVAGGGAINAMSLNYPNASRPDSIDINRLALHSGNAGGGLWTRIETTMSVDIGPHAVTGQVWLLGTNITFPAAGNVLGLVARNITLTARNNAGTATLTRTLGNVMLDGVSFGQSVYPSGGPNLTPNYSVAPGIITTPWVIISNHGGQDDGLRFFGEIAAYIDDVRLEYRGTESVRASGIYLYGMMNQTIAQPRSAPGANAMTNKTGAMRLGGSFPLYPNAYSHAPSGNTATLFSSVDVGSGGGNTLISINMPMMGSIRVKNFAIGTTAAGAFGTFALDDLVMYKNTFNIRNDL